MKTIIVTVEFEAPDHVTDKDISDFIDVEYGHCGGMKLDNPCRGDNLKISEAVWKNAR